MDFIKRFSCVIAFTMAFLMIATAIVFCVPSTRQTVLDFTPEYQNVVSENNELTNEVSSLNATITAKNTAISDLEDDIEILESQISELNETKTSLQNQLTTANNSITTLNATITVKETIIAGLESDIEDLEEQIDTLTETKLELENELEELNEDIINLQCTIQTAREYITSLENEKFDLEDDIDELELQVADLENQINLLEDSIESLEDEITLKTNQLTSASNTIISLQSQIQTLQARVLELETESSNSKVITDLSGTIWKFNETLTDYSFLPVFRESDILLNFEMYCQDFFLPANDSLGLSKVDYSSYGIGVLFCTEWFSDSQNSGFVYCGTSTNPMFTPGWYSSLSLDPADSIKLNDTPIIHIISGAGTTDATFIEWLKENATLLGTTNTDSQLPIYLHV